MRFLRMLWKCFTKWTPPPASEGELREAHVIVAYATGRLSDGSPGPGDVLIAGTARDLHDRFNLPVIAQEEIAMVAPDLPIAVAKDPGGGWKSSHEWNSAAVADFTTPICRQRRWNKAVIASAPGHIYRCVWVFERRGFVARAAPMREGNYFHPDHGMWCFRGGEMRLRFRDFFARLFFLARGDI